MNLESIFEEWEKDCKVDRAELGNAALDIPKLHHKYFKMMSNERLRYKKMEADHEELVTNKKDWLMGHLSKEELTELGWTPCLKSHLKSELDDALARDKQVTDSKLLLAYQKEKVDVLNEITKIISNRSFQINAAISWIKFQAGIS